MAEPSLNIRSEITRIKGVAQSPGEMGRDNSALIGPVPLTQLLANALGAINDYTNSAGQRAGILAAQVANIGTISAKGQKRSTTYFAGKKKAKN